jgi:multidrug resistance efflux pump
VRQKEADNLASAEKRRSEVRQAEADLAKALIEVSKAEILSRIEAEQNEIRERKARLQLEHLSRIHPDQELADVTALRLLELRRERERQSFEEAEANLEKLEVAAPIGGMVAVSTRYSGGAPVRPQEGDQMTRNSALMSIFDPTEMLVRVSVAEPDGALLQPGLQATVLVDAYPDVALRARFESASPIAAPALSRPVKSFSAVFRLEETDPRLMPDLSAAVVFDVDDTVPLSADGGLP